MKMKPQDDIKMIMRNGKITQKRLAELSGVGESVISLWLNGKSNMTHETMQRLCDALDAEVRIIKR